MILGLGFRVYVSVERFEGGAWDWDCWLNYRLRWCLGLGLMGRGGGLEGPSTQIIRWCLAFPILHSDCFFEVLGFGVSEPYP